MNTSTERTPSVQPHTDPATLQRVYIATSGVDLVETGLPLDWLTPQLVERCQQTGEDVAVWLCQEGSSPWLVATVRPAPHGRATVQWL